MDWEIAMDGSGPLNTDIVPERCSVLPSMSDISVPRRRSDRFLIWCESGS